MNVTRHWLAEKKGLVEPVRMIHGEATANAYREGGGWQVTGPFVLEPSTTEGAVGALRELVDAAEGVTETRNYDAAVRWRKALDRAIDALPDPSPRTDQTNTTEETR